jgi:hypothetical protein
MPGGPSTPHGVPEPWPPVLCPQECEDEVPDRPSRILVNTSFRSAVVNGVVSPSFATSCAVQGTLAMRVPAPPLLFIACWLAALPLLACGEQASIGAEGAPDASPPTDATPSGATDATTQTDTGAVGDSGGGPVDGAVRGDGSETTVCRTATCGTALDCAGPLGGVAACWTCSEGCCSPVVSGVDPGGACSTACTVAACNGAGGCGPPVLKREGTPCGTTCTVQVSGNQTQYCVTTAACAGDRCEQYTIHAYFCFGDPHGICGGCTGTADSCNRCPATGCSAQCTQMTAPPTSCP